MRFGVVFRNRKTYGSVRFSDVLSSTVRFGAVFGHRKTYGAVRCGFQEGKNPTVRGGVVNRTEPITKIAPSRTLIYMASQEEVVCAVPNMMRSCSILSVYVYIRTLVALLMMSLGRKNGLV